MDNALPRRRGAAILIVTAAAASVPVLGVFSLLLIIPALAAATAALDSPLKYFYFVPGGAIAVGLALLLGLSPALYGAAIAAFALCGIALGAAIRRGAGATAQTVTVSLVMLALGLGACAVWALAVYGSVRGAVEAAYGSAVSYVDYALDVVGRAAERYTAIDPTGAATFDLSSISGLDPEALVRTAAFSLPGIAVGAAFVCGWISELMSRPFLMLLGRRDLITAERRIRIPFSLAVIYLVLRIVLFFSSGESLARVCVSNVVGAIRPALLCVGAGYLFDVMRSSRSRFSVMFTIMFALSALIMPTILVSVLGAAGVIGTVVNYMREKAEGGE